MTALAPLDQRAAAWRAWAGRAAASGPGRSLAAIGFGLVLSFLIMVVITPNPGTAFGEFVFGSFRDAYSFGTMLSVATILTVTGYAVATAFKSGAFNIGAEGQVYCGGLTAAVVSHELSGLGAGSIPISLAAAAAAGLAFMAIPALLRVYLGVDEVVTTMMSSYIAMDVTRYLVKSRFKAPDSGALETRRLPRETWLPRLLDESNLNAGLFIALAVGAAFWLVFTKTRLGLRLRIVGLQPAFAENVGISPEKLLLGGLAASGALAGLAGGMAVIGISHNFIDSFSPQYGFLGITVALIGRLHPAGIVAAAVLYGTMITGATSMQTVSAVPFSLVYVLQGILILLITARGLRRKGGNG